MLAAARQALGGDKKLTAVKTVTATGRTRQVRGENLVPIEFEIFIELPDKYVRKDEIPAQESGPNASGFNGDELVQDPPPPPMPAPPPAPAAAPPGPQPMARPNPVGDARNDVETGLHAARARHVRHVVPIVPAHVHLRRGGRSAAGQGRRARRKGSEQLHAALVHQSGHAPAADGEVDAAGRAAARPRPDADAARGHGASRGRAARRAGPAAPPRRPPENRLYFADYRDVDGLQFPFRLRRAVGADTIEETTFDRYKLNSKIDPKRFEVRK